MTDTTQPDALLYGKRDHMALGEHYTRHVSAMTGEGLHSKSAIAGELAWRDSVIESLRTELAEARADAKALRSLVTRAIGEWSGAADIAPTPAVILMDGLREIDAAIAAKGE